MGREGRTLGNIGSFPELGDVQGIDGLESHRFKLDGRTPLLIIKVKGSLPGEILFYSHLDKQPSKPDLWSDGLSPFVGKRRGEWLYGRGSIDDGYGGISASVRSKHFRHMEWTTPPRRSLSKLARNQGHTIYRRIWITAHHTL